MRYLITLFCILYAGIMMAQETKIGQSEKPESEVSAVANPLDENNIIAAVINDFSLSQGSKSSRLAIYYSFNQGESWQKSNFDGFADGIESPPFIGDPVLTFDNNGLAYLTHLVWINNPEGVETRLYLAISHDKGKTWESHLLESGMGIVFDKPWITTDVSSSSPFHNSVYLTYVRASGTPNTIFEIYCLRKGESEETPLEAAVRVNQGDYHIVQFPSIDTDPDGRVFVSFVASDGSGVALYASYSEDGGKTFRPEVKIATLGMFYSDFQPLFSIPKQGLSRLYPCPHLRIDNSGGKYDNRIYLSWTDVEKGSYNYGLDVMLSWSDDKGMSWTEPKVVNTDNNTNNHQYYSTMEIDRNGQLLLCWYDRREDIENMNTHYYFARSLDGGESFSPEIKLTSKPSDFSRIGRKNFEFGIGEYTAIALSGNYAIPVWADGRNNNGDIDLYHAKILLSEPVATIEQTRNLNTYLQLSDPAPNPTNHSTQLELNLLETSTLSYQLNDLSGQVLKNWPARQFATGKHQINLMVNQIPPGVYFFTLKSQWGETSKRLLIIE